MDKAFARKTTIFKNGQYNLGDKCYVGETADEMSSADESVLPDVIGEVEAESTEIKGEGTPENNDATIFNNFSGSFFTGMQNNIDSLLKEYGEDSDSES